MASTGQTTPIKVYQDIFDYSQLAEFGSVTDISTQQHNLFNPPGASTVVSSPHKSSEHPSSSPPPTALTDADLNALSLPPPHPFEIPGSPTKKYMGPPRRPSVTSASQQRHLAGHYSYGVIDQENSAPPVKKEKVKQPIMDSSIEKKSAPKRPLSDASNSKERSNKRQKSSQASQEDFGAIEIPDPEEMPAVVDPGTKPEHSYAILIGMSLLRAPNRRLTLSQIYKWISDNFSYYSPADSGWQNSIRHNLSLNKNFIKQDRPKEDPGKGHYWTILPGQEHVFLKEKPTRRPSSSIMLPPNVARPSTASSATAPPPPLQAKNVDSSKFPEETELSSDATIPCSDPAMHDGQDVEAAMPPPSRALRSSPPPPADIRSSPPAAPPSRHSTRDDTPARSSRFLGHSRSGGRKTKFGGLGDSGYYSSIESSATKAQLPHPLFTSEADFDRPSLQPGRAELEIQRIRSSSYDSPVKPVPHKKTRSASHLPSSSPFRPFEKSSRRTGPMTPPVIFKRPAKPPASVSPNTNLRNHRNRIAELIATPDRMMHLFGEEKTATPLFDLPEGDGFSLYVDEPQFNASFDIFNEMDFPSPIARGSPEKRSANRPRIDRAATSTGALADITGSKSNRLFSSPTKFLNIPNDISLKTPGLSPSPRLKSASKAPTSNPFGTNDENSFLRTFDMNPAPDNFAIFADIHSDGSEEGLDICQGFGKIGASTVAANGSPVKGSRPALGRSTTTRF